MADSSQKHDLREISHLFLSGVRDRQTGNAPRPQRIPPSGRAEQPVELTGEELARVSAAASAAQPVASVTAVLAAHLEQRQGECVRQYASHVAAGGGRVGLIEVDACEFRLSIFERNPQGSPQPTHDAASPIDARRISESLEELSWEVDRWILCIGGGNRVPEARDLLRRAGRFALLSSCDPDGIVAAYRTLKGTADIVRRETWPPLSLAVFDASDANHAAGTFEKLSGVAMQFLSWPIEMDSQVEPADRVAEHLVLNCRATHEKSQTCAAPHWQVLSDFLTRTASAEAELSSIRRAEPAAAPRATAHPSMPATSNPATEASSVSTVAPNDSDEEIVELAGGNDPASVLTAVICGSPHQWVECPLRPPMCDDARLAVSRDRRLTLLAVTSKGLSDLRLIGQAYQWLSQNRALIAMALPQLAIDAHQMPRLQLLVDHADASAEVLQPMLHTGHVSVTAYRKVRFSGRRGLLLEAA